MYVNENIIENILPKWIPIIFKEYNISDIFSGDIYLFLNDIIRNNIIKQFETKI